MTESSQPIVHGSCLCKGVRYEVHGPFPDFYLCHCSRCRKATGAAYAANIFVEAGQFRWTAGEENLVRYDLPEARSFALVFCKICGSKLPHLTRNGARVSISAGTLDDPAPRQPAMHIYWDSRADWDHAEDDLPHHVDAPDSPLR